MADKVHANFALRSRDRVHECAVFVLVWRNAVATWRKKKKKKRRKTFFHTVGSIIRRFFSFRTYHFRSFLHVLDVTNSRYTRYRRKCFHSFSRSDETKNSFTSRPLNPTSSSFPQVPFTDTLGQIVKRR